MHFKYANTFWLILFLTATEFKTACVEIKILLMILLGPPLGAFVKTTSASLNTIGRAPESFRGLRPRSRNLNLP